MALPEYFETGPPPRRRRSPGVGSRRPAARLRPVAPAYGLDAAGRRELLGVLAGSIARGGEFLRRRLEAGDPNFTKMWDEIGGTDRFARPRRWFAEHRPRFAEALT